MTTAEMTASKERCNETGSTANFSTSLTTLMFNSTAPIRPRAYLLLPVFNIIFRLHKLQKNKKWKWLWEMREQEHNFFFFLFTDAWNRKNDGFVEHHLDQSPKWRRGKKKLSGNYIFSTQSFPFDDLFDKRCADVYVCAHSFVVVLFFFYLVSTKKKTVVSFQVHEAFRNHKFVSLHHREATNRWATLQAYPQEKRQTQRYCRERVEQNMFHSKQTNTRYPTRIFPCILMLCLYNLVVCPYLQAKREDFAS